MLSSRRAAAIVVALALCLSLPTAADARPAATCRCASVVFVQYMPWRAFDLRGARWNPIATPAIKARLQAYARGKTDAFKRVRARRVHQARLPRRGQVRDRRRSRAMGRRPDRPARVAGRDRRL